MRFPVENCYSKVIVSESLEIFWKYYYYYYIREYSVSVRNETAQLRKQPACAQVAYDAAADARSSPGAADSCAKWSRIT